jgi:hypothetical protein
MKNLNPGISNYFQEIVLTILSIAIVAVEVMGITVISTGILGA